MTEALPLCPVSKTGGMRRLSLSGTTGDAENRPVSETREYQCDNGDCMYKESHQGLFESN
jgi:hypothetical protein